jgi:UDP-4-amino-4,6-dideoxy-N-acetyl-beta-L-altrosamine transaminase
MIPYGRQEITKNDIKEVNKVLRSDYLTQGPLVPKFEKSIARYCGVDEAVAMNSATSALHVACLSLGLGPKDWLWTSANTFVASANCALYCGAQIDFVDIDPRTYNISIIELKKKLKWAKVKKKLPKIIIPVHFAGQPADMKSIFELSKKYGFKIIEDASHAIGASYNKFKVGSCKYSDITVFSFHPVKIITTAEGGMALTKDKAISNIMRRLSNHGITRDKKLMIKRPKEEIWNYQQIELGYNFRMNDIQAALGLSQLNRLDKYIKIRHKIANKYNLMFKDLDIIKPFQSKYCYSSYHLYPIRISQKKVKNKQKKFYNNLLKAGIGVNLHYIPVHRHPFYEKLGFKFNDFPESELFHREVISLPIYPNLTSENLDFVINTVLKFFRD